MASVEVTRLDLENISKSPLKGLHHVSRVTSSRWGEEQFVHVHPKRFPDLSENPELYSLYKSTDSTPKTAGVYTPYYLSDSFDLDELLSRYNEDIQPSILLFRQRQLAYRGQGFKKVPYIVHELNYPGEKMDPYYYERPSAEAIAKYFSPEELKPNLEVAYPTGPADSAINFHIAFLLATGKIKGAGSNKPVVRSRELTELTYLGTTVDEKILLEGFQQLVTEPNLAYLKRREVMEGVDITAFFGNIADWQLDLTEKVQQKETGSTPKCYFTYPLDLSSELQPVLDFLPYIAMNTLKYFLALPKLIKKGQLFDPAALTTQVKNLFGYTEYRLVEELKSELREESADLADLYKSALKSAPSLAQQVKEIRDFISNMKKPFQEVLTLYQQKPYLLNRTSPKSAYLDEMVSLGKLRERVLREGGRAPRKPFYFKVVKDVKSNRV